MWFDSDEAGRAATGWASWGNQLDLSARTIRLELESVAMGGWSGGTAELAGAAQELWTLSTFTRLVQSAVARADGSFPTGSGGAAALWDEAARSVRQTMGYRDRPADDAAMTRWLYLAADHEVREHFEAEFGRDPAAVLTQLEREHAVLYWNSLGRRDQEILIDTRPEVVVFHVLGNGARIDATALDSLERANNFPLFTNEFGLAVEASVGLRVVSIDVGAGVTLITTKNNDGSVEMTFVEEVSAGVSADIDVPRAAEASASAGVFGEAQQTFWFADEAAAAEAVAVLRDAVAQDASFGEAAKDLGGVVWNVSTAPTNALIWGVNLLNPFSDVPSIPGYDLTPETVNRLRELWSNNGMTHQEGVGVYAGVSAEFDANVGVIEAELAASAEARLMFYDSDAAAADVTGAVGQTGVMFSGVAAIDVDAEISGLDRDVGGHAAAEVGYLVDLHHIDGDGTYLTVTVHGDVAAGSSLELFDLGQVELDTTIDRTASMTASITVPVNDATTDAVGQLGVDLANGRSPAEGIRELYDTAEIDVTISTGYSSTTEFEVDVVAANVNVTQESSQDTTQTSLHKYPDGSVFSRFDVSRMIDEARPG